MKTILDFGFSILDWRKRSSGRRVSNRNRLALLALLMALSCATVLAQEEPPPEGEKPPEKKGGTLKPRPDDDPAAAQFIAKLAPARPQMAGAAAGPIVRHVLSPDGQYLYYFRDLNAPAAKPAPEKREPVKPAEKPRYVLYRVSQSKSEEKVMETGYDAVAPLFFPDGRLLVVARTFDQNGDGAINFNDERSLLVCNSDGASEHEIATLRPFETPLAIWREGKEVLLADYARDDINGWISTLPISRGQRTPLTRGFNVSMVLDDGKIVVERFVSPKPAAEQPTNPWAWRFPQGEEEEAEEVEPPPEASLLDRTQHILFNPADPANEIELFNPAQRARLCVYGEGSFFGYQQSTRNLNAGRFPNGSFRQSRSLESFELLVLDSPTQYDSKAPQARNDYFPLAWISGKGLLATEVSNLKTRLVLMDRSSGLNLLPITEMGFDAQGICASQNGLTVAWLTVEDTNEDGYLDPWQDNARVWFLQIAPRE
jgi:hypothetical protein